MKITPKSRRSTNVIDKRGESHKKKRGAIFGKKTRQNRDPIDKAIGSWGKSVNRGRNKTVGEKKGRTGTPVKNKRTTRRT
jgi:hypothetical protein